MYTQILLNNEIICTIYCYWEVQRPRTWSDYFRSYIYTYPKILRYSVKNQKKYTYNGAAQAIIDLLKTYEKKTIFILQIPIYKIKHTIKYQSEFSLREIAASLLVSTRDFYTDQSITREEQGDPDLDHLSILKPIGL